MTEPLTGARAPVPFPVLGHVDPHVWPQRKTMRHGEAYCLMLYASDQGNVEWLWNSRDGVTPFMIGDALHHCVWMADAFCPFFVPPIGMRIFIDLTMARAREFAKARVSRYWNHPEVNLRERYKDTTFEEAVEITARDLFHPEHQPDIVAVDETLQAKFHRRARMLDLEIP